MYHIKFLISSLTTRKQVLYNIKSRSDSYKKSQAIPLESKMFCENYIFLTINVNRKITRINLIELRGKMET